MSTVRLQIVNAIATALGTATGLTVHRNLDYALQDTNLPALAVISADDAPTGEYAMAALSQRAQVDIAVLVGREANPEAAADPYEAQVHAALYGAQTFAGHHVVTRRVAGGWQFDLGDTAQRLLRYEFSYFCAVADLEAAA